LTQLQSASQHAPLRSQNGLETRTSSGTLTPPPYPLHMAVGSNGASQCSQMHRYSQQTPTVWLYCSTDRFPCGKRRCRSQQPEARCPRNVMPRAVSPHRCPEGRRKQCWEGNGSLALVFGRPEPPAGLGLPQSGDAGASCLRGPRLRRAAVAPVWKLESRTWRGTAFVCWRVTRAGGRKGSGEPMSYCRNNSLVPERHVNAPPR